MKFGVAKPRRGDKKTMVSTNRPGRRWSEAEPLSSVWSLEFGVSKPRRGDKTTGRRWSVAEPLLIMATHVKPRRGDRTYLASSLTTKFVSSASPSRFQFGVRSRCIIPKRTTGIDPAPNPAPTRGGESWGRAFLSSLTSHPLPLTPYH